MEFVEPKVHLVGETQLVQLGMAEYLTNLGVPAWETSNEGSGEAVSAPEELTEVMGRLCYKSFAPGLNANVTKVREGNDTYMDNIIKVGHGSVMEHAQVSFIFEDVSRVLTHELVRHRVGTAISQESLRYVRLTELKAFFPSCLEENEDAKDFMEACFETMEFWQKQLAEMFDIDNVEDFAKKKLLTSAFRRVAPIGLATNIGWSCNFRTLRHVIEMRTSPHAEEEIRHVFTQVYEIVKERYPNFFSDYTVDMVDGYPHVYSDNRCI